MPDQDAIPFPFEPYPQQRDLMRSIYDCIEKSSVGCFESPTGTGKSLSVICAVMSWQYKEEDRLLAKQSSVSLKSKSNKEDDWLVAFQSSFENDSAECKRNQRAYDMHLAMKERVRRASLSNPQQRNHGNQYRKMSKSNDTSRDMGSDVNHSESKSEVEDEFSLKHYDSSDECSQTSKRNSSQTSASRTDCSDSEDDDDDNENALGLPKIYYCSRTHSQISQFVTEIKRTAFANARCITLGSRRNMCINSGVTKLGSDSKISEMCLDMQKSKSKIVKATDENGYQSRKQKTKAPSLKPCQYHNKEKEKDFADYANGKIHDIESLITLGDQLAACPYYATRRAVHDAQVISYGRIVLMM